MSTTSERIFNLALTVQRQLKQIYNIRPSLECVEQAIALAEDEDQIDLAHARQVDCLALVHLHLSAATRLFYQNRPSHSEEARALFHERTVRDKGWIVKSAHA
jgi:hypothetical protein